MERQRQSISVEADKVTVSASQAIKKINQQASGVVQVAVAKDYLARGRKELITAESLRALSVLTMFFAVYVLGSTIFDLPFLDTVKVSGEVNAASGDAGVVSSLTNGIDSVQAGLRVMLSILLSVPAAYLARESTKHRVQQNAYQQIAMNVDAVHTLVSGLDPEVQNEVISGMANRLFANPVGVGQNGNAADSFPINSGELLMKMMDKMDFKSPPQGNNSTADNPK